MKFKSFFQYALFIGALATAFSSCKKEEDDDHQHDDNTTPKTVTITVNEPLENAQFNLGQELSFDISVSANFEMHGWEIKLINLSDNNALVFEADLHDHGTSYTIHEHWTNNVTMMSDMELQIKVAKGHEESDGYETKNVHFHCHNM